MVAVLPQWPQGLEYGQAFKHHLEDAEVNRALYSDKNGYPEKVIHKVLKYVHRRNGKLILLFW